MQNQQRPVINYKIDNNNILLNCTPLYTTYIGEESLLTSLDLFIDGSPVLKPNRSYGGITAGTTSFEAGNIFDTQNPDIKSLEKLLLGECQKYYESLSKYSERPALDLEIGIEG